MFGTTACFSSKHTIHYNILLLDQMRQIGIIHTTLSDVQHKLTTNFLTGFNNTVNLSNL